MRPNWKEYVLIVIAFIFSGYLYSLFSYWSVANFIISNSLSTYFETPLWHVEVILVGLLFGSLYIGINKLTDSQFLRKKSFGFNILIISALYIIALALVTLILLILFTSANWISAAEVIIFMSDVTPLFMVSTLLYFLLFILFLNFVRYVKVKFGANTLVDLLTGKFHHPRNLNLAFMFLDLKNSTQHAERLGHQLYSSFIKDCVHLLSPYLIKHKAYVYQYVGDEVVLYWNTSKPNWELNICQCFYGFKSELQKNKSYFAKIYGIAPEFKAGVDAGIVTATEIGDLKREIAFHGDVLNTAARLEAKCNEYNSGLIVSESLKDALQKTDAFQLGFLSDLPLKGKSDKVAFYQVLSSTNS